MLTSIWNCACSSRKIDHTSSTEELHRDSRVSCKHKSDDADVVEGLNYLGNIEAK